MKNFLSTLAIQQLEGGTYTIDTVLNVIKQITDWALAVGISLAGIALVVSFIYDLIDGLLQIIKELNAFDIINSLSNNQTFINFYNGAMAIAVTLFALFIVWRFVNKLLDPDEETTFKMIIMEAVKCGTLIMLSTFLFVQVSNFSITLSNYTGNIFETTSNSKMSDSMLTMFISYRDGYKNSEKFVLTGENKSVIITRYEKERNN